MVFIFQDSSEDTFQKEAFILFPRDLFQKSVIYKKYLKKQQQNCYKTFPLSIIALLQKWELSMKTIIEPFRIKSVEEFKLTTKEEREKKIKAAGYNLFLIPAADIMIDLLTDSGTGAMSNEQWACIMKGDESYAGAKSFFSLKKTVNEIMGFDNFLPTHQGRASERILFQLVGGEGKVFPNNCHFDTTRANIENTKALALDLAVDEAYDPSNMNPFKGNMDIEKLENCFKTYGAENIPLVMITITNNSCGGQPVSLENMQAVKTVCNKYNTPLFLDACRFAENAMFIKKREKKYQNSSIQEIVKATFDLADGATFSAKKDGIVNIGGLLLIRDPELFEKAKNLLILTEGFPTYGGLAGRDLEAMAQGLKEVLSEDYLAYRLRFVEYIGEKLLKHGIPFVQPTGGHALYIDAKAFYPHIDRSQFPGHVLACELYKHAGIRSCEIGSVMFGAAGNYQGMELVRLAFPRRVYTQSHMDYVIEALVELSQNKEKAQGMKIIKQPKALRHFSCTFDYVTASKPVESELREKSLV